VPEGELTPKEVGGFRILRRLASGANSDVLLARAEGPHGFQRVVALKILLARAKPTPEFERRFAAEASAYARLSHPAVVKLYDFFSADNQLVMVLEFVDGLPLHKLRAMLAISGERIDDTAALFLGFRLFSALAAAHGARDPATGEFAPIAHHDVNPSNILVPWDGHVKLGDFGIARAAGVETDPRSGFIKGTYGYLAPEQVLGKEVSVRADIYSAGLILWELLARRKAIQRGGLDDAQVQKAMAEPDFPTLDSVRPDMDPAVRAAVRRTLEPDPEKRSIAADEMVSILRQAVVIEDGRRSLADAVTRVRAPAPQDPLAATAEGPAQVEPEAEGTPTPRGRAVAPSDVEQTARYQIGEDHQGELGKIAFYGRIKLPAESDPPRARVRSTRPPPITLEPSDEPTAVVPSPHLQISPAPPKPPPPKPAKPPKPPPSDPAVAGRGKPIPRPVADKKISSFPTVRAPPLEEQETAAPPPPAPVAGPERSEARDSGWDPVEAPPRKPVPQSDLAATVAGAPSPLAADAPSNAAVPSGGAEEAPAPTPPGDVSPSPDAPTLVAPRAADVAAAPAVVAPPEASTGPAPFTERSPEAAADAFRGGTVKIEPPAGGFPGLAPAPDVAEAQVIAAPPAPVVRTDRPPYAASSLPPTAAPSKSRWFVAVVAVIALAAGVAFALVQQRRGAVVAPSDTSSAARPQATASGSATPSTSAASAAVSASASAAAPSALPSAEPSAMPSATPPLASASTSASPAPPAPSATPSASAPVAPPPAASQAPAPSAAPSPPPPASSIPAGSGELDLPASAAGHRVYVDGKVAGEGAAPITVRCGPHTVRIGSAGTERKIDVPCGAALTLP